MNACGKAKYMACACATVAYGCSNAPTKASVTLEPRIEQSITSNDVVNNSDATVPTSFDQAMSITVGANVPCVVHPDGVTDDATRQGLIAADPDGLIRFYPPPATWGTRLVFSCTVGTTTSSQVVDLSDASTYTLVDTTPRVVSVRPPLSGDPTTPSQQELLAAGYPPRPDPAIDPARYNMWLTRVSRPMNRIAAVGVTVLGQSGDPYEGTYSTTITSPATNFPGWSGQLMDAQGWKGGGGTIPINNGTTTYFLYEVQSSVPNGGPCGAACAAALWGGIGGWNDASGGLIQSGVWVDGPNCITTSCRAPGSPFFWYEFAGNGSFSKVLDMRGLFAIGDSFFTDGYGVTDSTCQQFSVSAPYACFYFDDETQNWYVSNIPFQRPNGTTFDGPTFEQIAEMPNANQQFATFYSDIMTITAWDQNEAPHTDFTDPWIFVTLSNTTTNNMLAKPFFYENSGGATSPTQTNIEIQWLSGL